MVANLLIVLHLLFILFVIGGGLLVLRWPRLRYLHLPAALWGAVVELKGWICPLTPLEQHFRQAAGQDLFAAGFINHFILPLVYPPGLTRPGQIFLGLVVIAINIALYASFFFRKKKAKARK